MIFSAAAIVSGLSAVVPSVVKWIAGDEAEETATEILDVAKNVTGIDDGAQAVEAIKADPKLLADFKLQYKDLELKFYQAATERMSMVNQTMRVEYEAKGWFKTGWRSFIGWSFGFSLAFYMISMCVTFVWVTIDNPAQAGTVIENMSKLAGALSMTWGVCMTVLGVAVKKRSDDKAAASGAPASGILQGLAGMFGGRK